MHSLKNWLTIKKTAGMAHQTTHTKGKQTDDYSPPMFIYAIVGVGSPLWLWDYAEIAMKITTKAVANTLREPHVTGVVGMGLYHPSTSCGRGPRRCNIVLRRLSLLRRPYSMVKVSVYRTEEGLIQQISSKGHASTDLTCTQVSVLMLALERGLRQAVGIDKLWYARNVTDGVIQIIWDTEDVEQMKGAAVLSSAIVLTLQQIALLSDGDVVVTERKAVEAEEDE